MTSIISHFNDNKAVPRFRTVPRISLYLLGILLFWSCQATLTAQEMITPPSAVKTNTAQNLNKPYLILISLDGYRWDYTKRFQPPNISRFAENGVQAASLISCFPSKTFPNHYSIATGMYPENHGLVDNSFYDPERKSLYKISYRKEVEDGSWYSGTPIWVQAARAGMVTASFFFVGSEADVGGVQPTYYYRYDGSVPNEKRVEQILAWLRMPEEKRPHVIAGYFSDMDDVGHRVGPRTDEPLKAKLMSLDSTLGLLFREVEKLNLPVNIILVSDHGMAEVPVDHFLPIESIEDDDHYLTVSNGALAHLYIKEGIQVDSIYQELKSREKHFKVYRTEEAPYYHDSISNPRLGDLIVIPDYPYYFKDLWGMAALKRSNIKVKGEHGFDPAIPDLHGIFYASGPAFKEKFFIPSFENVHIYPVMCRILGLDIPSEVDGRAEVLEAILLSF